MTKRLKWLSFLILAIVQAAAYINDNDIDLANYLSLLNSKEQDVVELLQEDFEDEGRYRNANNPVATTWLVSFEHIRNRDPLAADYLSFMSCLWRTAMDAYSTFQYSGARDSLLRQPYVSKW